MSNKIITQCLLVDDEAIAREVIETHISKIPEFRVVASCSNAIEAFDILRKQKIDIIFLDINMPEISGISFAKAINPEIKVIFTTAYREYAVEGFELQVVDYLMKPISFDRLLKALTVFHNVSNKVPTKINRSSEEATFMFVRSNRKMIKLDHDEILYIESYSDYLKIHLTSKIVVTRETISTIDAKLPKNRFIRIHRSFIIAINTIISFTSEEITTKKKVFTISRGYKTGVLKMLNSY